MVNRTVVGGNQIPMLRHTLQKKFRPLCHECENFNTSTTSKHSIKFTNGSLKLNRDKFALIYRRWKFEKGKLRLTITANSDHKHKSTRQIPPAVGGRMGKLCSLPGRNSWIAGFVEFCSRSRAEKKVNVVYCMVCF